MLSSTHQDRLKQWQERINHRLEELSAGENTAEKAMRYSLQAGGKRIRPVLVLEFCRMCGGNPDTALDIACALEMMHTFSLIHDDLPCMDNDDYRRGKPSCHKQYGEAQALLAGDALSILPFEIIAKQAFSGKIPANTAMEITYELARAVGNAGMIGGQVMDMEAEGKALTEQELTLLQEKKTGALIATSCVIGCLLAECRGKIPKARAYAQSLGLAFQIEDDILDVSGTFTELGKPIGSDNAQHKTTFVSLYGLENARQRAEVLTDEALRVLETFPDAEFLKELTQSLLTRRN